MSQLKIISTFILFIFFISSGDFAGAKVIDTGAYNNNLRTCLGGYFALCRHEILTSEDAKQVRNAEYQTNLRTCLGGYSALCRHGILTSLDAKQVITAEYRTNLRTCLGGYFALCKHEILKSVDVKQVKTAEYRTNLHTCLGGYSVLCRHGILTSLDAKQVRNAENQKGHASVRQKSTRSYAIPTFNGYPCTINCSGHDAGYEWAEENDIDDPDDCDGKSNSFIEGCQSYAEEQQAEESDE